ncbi:MAG: peptide-methionine (S)-S-oxide reductase MsrA [Flavobacteriaceae bacterium]
MKIGLSYIALIWTLQTCVQSSPAVNYPDPVWTPPTQEWPQETRKAYFAAGCFWCVEAIFESVRGVEEVYSGYAGGHTINPNYNQIGTGKTGHAEAVEVIYDPAIVNFKTLLQVFFGSHDPTTPNRQGPDRGTQYRSIAFYTTDGEREIIQKYIAQLEAAEIFNAPLVTEVKPLKKFYYAEEYHQDYEKRNPNNPYVQRVSIPRLRKFQNRYPELLNTDH